MDTLRGLLARERRDDRLALREDGTGREYDSHRLLTNAWKVSNLLHQCGVRAGHTVGLVGRTPEAVLAFLATASLGAVVRFDPSDESDLRAVVAPTNETGRFDLPPGSTPVAYGAEPDDPGTRYFERDVWSQNPTLAPAAVAPDDPVLATADGSFTHADLLDGAARAVERTDMDAGTTVAVRAPLALAGTVAAGLVAPLMADAIVVFPDADTVADVAVATDSAPESTVCDPTSLLDDLP
ncbi:hypothetical protein [Halococcus sp. IIIV-5B]|uniref:hypothetical protein n=1 Tax=Halococcus sp. IIIV-5B TaxID=2321230 RepID=UPI000E763F25|nr:hypothetical protein [Halococcus sp. IIIV-5B]RJS99031.1 hypothetical protein D3261_16425 [Halococcus sp. IIIV-5B]